MQPSRRHSIITGVAVLAMQAERRIACRIAGWLTPRPLGVAAFLILGLIASGARSTAAAAANDAVKIVALLNIQFLNDHEDLEPTTNAERVRLASIESLFKAKLEASGRYKFVSIPADAAAKIAAGPEVGACGGCEFEYGKQLGADYAAWIVVQKVSDLILNLNVYMVDTAAKKLAFVHGPLLRRRSIRIMVRALGPALKEPAPCRCSLTTTNWTFSTA